MSYTTQVQWIDESREIFIEVINVNKSIHMNITCFKDRPEESFINICDLTDGAIEDIINMLMDAKERRKNNET